ncbi:MAG: saccharopine dehydrogenase NADP-binding domain-containing protein [Acidimicrobiia bacterium]
MKVVLLGAGGGMGRTAAEHLAQDSSITSLVLADYVEEAAQRIAAGISEPKTTITPTQIDALDKEALEALLSDADLVVNCAGPFFRLGVPTLKAAIATKTNYIDICDDPEPTKAMFALDAEATAAGIAAVIGMGASPGLSNLLAKRAASQLDQVEDCFTAWPLGVETSGWSENTGGTVPGSTKPSAAAVHLMEQIHGKVTIAEGGHHIDVPPLEAVQLDFPGFGSGTGYIVGHPEPLTLISSLGLKGRSANVIMTSKRVISLLVELQRQLDASGLSIEEAASVLVKPSSRPDILETLSAQNYEDYGELPSFFALATGTLNGQRTTVGCHAATLPSGMDGSTGIPVALGAKQMLQSKLTPGVHSPEAVINGTRLLTDLMPYCTTEVNSLDELAPVSLATTSP